MPHILAIVNILGGFLMLLAACDSLAGYPRHNIGSAGFWGIIGLVLVYNSFRLWP